MPGESSSPPLALRFKGFTTYSPVYITGIHPGARPKNRCRSHSCGMVPFCFSTISSPGCLGHPVWQQQLTVSSWPLSPSQRMLKLLVYRP